MFGKKVSTLALVVLAIGAIGCSEAVTIGGEPGSAVNVGEVAAAPFDYTDYETVLSKYVSDEGFVDYEGLKNDREALDRFNASLGDVSPATYNSWSESERLAFLINAYNSLTLVSIIDNYPVESIRKIGGVWNGRRFPVAGQEVTLNNIEHDTIRVLFSEPRIHFAVNCASIGCPILRNEPFTGEALDTQLDEQVNVSFDGDLHFRIDRQENKVYLSAVFKWFGEDWEPGFSQEESLPGLNDRETAFANFASQYVGPEDREFLMRGGYDIAFIDWDWGLNEQS